MRPIVMRPKGYREAGSIGQTVKSAIEKHAWMKDHPINCDGTKILQHGSRPRDGGGMMLPSQAF